MRDFKGAEICLVHTLLLPFRGGITFANIVGPPMEEYYKTVLDYKNATTLAVSTAMEAMKAESSVKCYRSLHLSEDAQIRRPASHQKNVHTRVPEMLTANRKIGSLPPNRTGICISQKFWNPTNDHTDKRYMVLLRQVWSGNQPKPIKGVETKADTRLVIKDEDPCPFHKEAGKYTCFRDCCKSEYLKRDLKAKEKFNNGWTSVCYEPWDFDTSYPL